MKDSGNHHLFMFAIPLLEEHQPPPINHSLSAEKLANMITMYDRYIPPDQRPDYLPPLSTLTATASSSSTASLTTAQAPLQRHKQSKCSTPGCDGKGHKNPSKWAQGHTTRAGCPLANKLLSFHFTPCITFCYKNVGTCAL